MLSSLGAVVLLFFVLAVIGTLAWGAISAAPWVPMPARDVERLLALVALKPGDVLFDLGCGDGRLLIQAAERYGARAVGFELALVPYVMAQLRRLASSKRQLITIHYKDFWRVNFNSANAVVCFLTPYAMRKLEHKIPSELQPGARFATYAFRLHSVPEVRADKPTPTSAPIYLYTKSVQA